MSEYIAAMKGIQAINDHKSPKKSGLNKNEVDELKQFLQERA